MSNLDIALGRKVLTIGKKYEVVIHGYPGVNILIFYGYLEEKGQTWAVFHFSESPDDELVVRITLDNLCVSDLGTFDACFASAQKQEEARSKDMEMLAQKAKELSELLQANK